MLKLKVPATSANLGPGFDSLGIAYSIEGYGDNVVPALTGGFTINVLEGEKLIYNKIVVTDDKIKVILVVSNFQLKTEELRAVLKALQGKISESLSWTC